MKLTNQYLHNAFRQLPREYFQHTDTSAQTQVSSPVCT